jgi:hypothetical protein
VLDERRGPLPEDREFFLDQFFAIVCTLRSVPSHVVPDAAKDLFRGAIQNNKRVNSGDRGDVFCLARVPRDAVQDEYVSLHEAGAVEEQPDDLFRKGKALVFEQEAPIEYAMDESELCLRVGCGALSA